jgi:hypothetical protein
MKIYTFYTDTHESMLNDWFLPSFKLYNPNLEIIVKKFDQECPSGSFMEDGWHKTMLKKVDYIIEAIEKNWNSEFIHADCDIQCFGPIVDDIANQLKDNDLVGLDETPIYLNKEICCGFFICKGNENTFKLFHHIKSVVNKNLNDQMALNSLKQYYIKSDVLDLKYYNITHSLGPMIWTPEIEIPNISKNILIHHANWIVGVENKIKNLKLVKEKIKNSG